VPFLFEGLPSPLSGESRDDPSTDLTQQLVSAGGLDLAQGFQRIKNTAMRRSVVALVEELANVQGARGYAAGMRVREGANERAQVQDRASRRL
jgi:hypothetical protein